MGHLPISPAMRCGVSADSRARPASPAAERSLQLMSSAAAAALTRAAAATAEKGHLESVNCRDHIEAPLLSMLQQQQQRKQQQHQSGTIGDFPLSLVSRAMFPLNPNLELRPCCVEGPPFHYEALRPKPTT
ncbi:phosphatidylinositol N-acetylglucosaminyltransferase subunit, putative [Eimeria brunetti]|uniref:Phosphatidylinositol N-acetylglucosaminyltransferase subunit, putative n=1 Tax=Eimeria brunetti TaxID=51314 RepID=U6LF57_9EIME|nr:phosphatidylinositol N-acetylglucosaminyltransferase subunit, putative [Eimeria brunetti]